MNDPVLEAVLLDLVEFSGDENLPDALFQVLEAATNMFDDDRVKKAAGKLVMHIRGGGKVGDHPAAGILRTFHKTTQGNHPLKSHPIVQKAISHAFGK